MISPILRTAATRLLSLLLLFALFLLLRGHNAPGGGFSAGLVAGAAYTLYAMARTEAAAREVLVLEPPTLLASGLLVALVAALIGPLAGQPVLTGLWIEAPVATAGTVALGTPMLFDLGVFLTVLGTTTAITLAWEAIR